MNPCTLLRSDTAGSQNLDGEVQRQGAGMKQIQWPEIDRAAGEISPAGRLRDDSPSAGGEIDFQHADGIVAVLGVGRTLLSAGPSWWLALRELRYSLASAADSTSEITLSTSASEVR